MEKARITTGPVASHYEAPNERIVEFSWPDGNGGLISFRQLNDGTPIVELYRLDQAIVVPSPSYG